MMEPVTKSCGNIFNDLGFPAPEAENLFIRSRLIFELGEYIKENKLTQTKAAEVMGVNQPRISDLVRGKIDLFTIDMLVNCAWATYICQEVYNRKRFRDYGEDEDEEPQK